MTEYLLKKGNEMLIGRRARFKMDHRYGKKLWWQPGIIVQHAGLEHVGLSLQFDKTVKLTDNTDMQSCYIMEGSIELLE